MLIYHLSHIDLDGYGCQFLLNHTQNTECHFFNANYGAVVAHRLKEIIVKIKKELLSCTILITDLNLSIDECKYLEKEVQKLEENNKNLTIKIQLLDHHMTGKASAQKYNWYLLDTERCATKITYDFILDGFLSFKEEDKKNLGDFVDIINAVDIWLQDDVKRFEYGKVCMRLISETRELNRYMFPLQDRAYKFNLLKEASNIQYEENNNILLDEKVHQLKKNYFKNDTDNTLDNLVSKTVVGLLGKQKEDLTIYYRGYKGLLSYCVGNTSIIGNTFLLSYPEYDFVVDIGPRGTMSFRANNNVNVAYIAKEWADGGGHSNASGGRIHKFKEEYSYKKVKDKIQQLIEDKEYKASDLIKTKQ